MQSSNHLMWGEPVQTGLPPSSTHTRPCVCAKHMDGSTRRARPPPIIHISSRTSSSLECQPKYQIRAIVLYRRLYTAWSQPRALVTVSRNCPEYENTWHPKQDSFFSLFTKTDRGVHHHRHNRDSAEHQSHAKFEQSSALSKSNVARSR